jgi:hypothetical protein
VSKGWGEGREPTTCVDGLSFLHRKNGFVHSLSFE